eukprot:3283525-Rhodomonas_salina.1
METDRDLQSDAGIHSTSFDSGGNVGSSICDCERTGEPAITAPKITTDPAEKSATALARATVSLRLRSPPCTEFD